MTEMAEKGITSMLEERRVFYPPQEISAGAYFKSIEEYKKIYQKSIEDPEGFWGEKAEQLDWFKKWDRVLDADFPEARHEWFVGGKLNVSYNCVDRHLKTWRRSKVALYWEGEPGDVRVLSYSTLFNEVNKCASVLKNCGVGKGDTVTVGVEPDQSLG